MLEMKENQDVTIGKPSPGHNKMCEETTKYVTLT